MQTIKGLVVLLVVAAAVLTFCAINDLKSQARYAMEMNNAALTGPVRIAKQPPVRTTTNAVNQARQKTGHANL